MYEKTQIRERRFASSSIVSITQGDRDYVCMLCYDKNRIGPIHGGKCIRCGNTSMLLPKAGLLNDHRILQQYQVDQIIGDIMSQGIMSLNRGYIEPQAYLQLMETIIQREFENIMGGMLLPVKIKDKAQKIAAARILAQAQFQTGLMAANRQIMVVPFGSKENPVWTFMVGYPGYESIARRVCAVKGEEYDFGEGHEIIVLTPAEIIAARADRCPDCGGKGKKWDKKTEKFDKKCWNCNGIGNISPEKMIAVRVPFYYTADYGVAEKTGRVDSYMANPPSELSIWYDWQSIPTTKSGRWVAEKRSRTGMLRRKFADGMMLETMSQIGAITRHQIAPRDDEYAIDTLPNGDGVKIDDQAVTIFALPPDFPSISDGPTDEEMMASVKSYMTDVLEIGDIKMPGGGTAHKNTPSLILGDNKTWEDLSGLEVHNILIALYKIGQITLPKGSSGYMASYEEIKKRAVAHNTKEERWMT